MSNAGIEMEVAFGSLQTRRRMPSSMSDLLWIAAVEPPYEQDPLTLKQDEIDFIKGFAEEAAEHIEAIEAEFRGP